MCRFLCAVIFVLIFMCVGFLRAADAVTIDPNRAEFIVKAGAKITKEYKVVNTESKTIDVSIFPELSKFDFAKDATGWIHVSPDKVTVAPSKSKKIVCTVTVPKDASGEYTSSLVIKSLTNKTVLGESELVAQIRLALYVVIKGTENISAEITQTEVISSDPFKLSVKISNKSNVHIRPSGNIRIVKSQISGAGVAEEKQISIFRLNPKEGPLFPGVVGEIGPKESKDKLEQGHYVGYIDLDLGCGIRLAKKIEFDVPAGK